MKGGKALVMLALAMLSSGSLGAAFSMGGTGAFGASQPSAARNGNSIFVAHGFLDGMEMLILESTDLGVNFGDENSFFYDVRSYDPHPSILDSGDGNKWVFFQYRGFLLFTNTQVDYNTHYMIDTNTYPSLNPSAVKSGDEFRVFFSTDNGKLYEHTSSGEFAFTEITWSGPVFLNDGRNPDAAVDSEGSTWLVFDESDRIYWKKDAGSWTNQADTGLSGEKPSVAAAPGGTIFIAYERSGSVYYSKSSDGGASWSAESLIAEGHNPDIVETGEATAIAFFDKDGRVYSESIS